MSVKKAINDLIPPEWDYVLRKNKVLTHFIDYVYNYNVPSIWRNRYGFKEALKLLKYRINKAHAYSTIFVCIDPWNTYEGYEFWLKINQDINSYKEQIR